MTECRNRTVYFRVLIVLFLIFSPHKLFAEELIPLKILLNTVDKGEYFVLLADNDDILVSVEDIKAIGLNIRGFTNNVNGVRYISLNEIKSRVQYRMDEKALTLVLTADTALLKKTSLDLSQNQFIRKNPLGIESAYLNFSLITSGEDREGVTSYDVPLEGVISAHDLVFQSTFSFHRDETRQEWVRGLTNVTRDFPGRLNRLVVGDFIARGGNLGGSGTFLGLSFTKKFDMATYFTKYPGANVGGVLSTPSKVNLYVNDALIKSELLPPGEFEISNLPNLFGAGIVTMEVEDAFGRKTKTRVPYYVSTRMLKSGLHDFSYNVGFRRDSILVPNPSYESNPSAIGFHRYGFSRFFTAGYSFEMSEKIKNAGASVNVLLGFLGEFEFISALSEYNGETGSAYLTRYAFTSKYVHWRYGYRANTANYSTLTKVSEPKHNHSFGVGLHGFSLGSLSLNYSLTDTQKNQTHEIDKQWSLIYSLRVAKRTSLLFRGTRSISENGTADSFFVSINSSLGKQVSVNSSYQDFQGSRDTSAYIQKAIPVGVGFGGRARLTQNDDVDSTGNREKDLSYDGSLTVKNKYIDLTGDYSKRNEHHSYRSQASSSFAFINNGFYVTRPIRDSFGLAKVGDLDDVKVFYNSELVGSTNNGELIVPSLFSYADNRISIEAEDIPVDISVKTASKLVSPKYRTGSVANFDIERFQGFVGYMSILKNKIKKTADFASFSLRKKNATFDTIIGRGGEFYFENLEPGVYVGEVRLESESCLFKMKIPKSKEILVELGKFVCKMKDT